MLWLLLLGNPMPDMVFNEVVVAPDNAEFLEVSVFSVDTDLSGYYLVTPSCSLRFKDGATIHPGQYLLLDTSVLEGSFSLDDNVGWLKIVDPQGLAWAWMEYSRSSSNCYEDAYTPPPGWSANFHRGVPYAYYLDSTPTPGAPNDDLGFHRFHGFVYDQETGDPIPNAQVHIHFLEQWCMPLYIDFYDTSNADGSWEVALSSWYLGSNRATFYLAAAGYQDYIYPDTVEVPYNFVDIELDFYLSRLGATEVGENADYIRLFPNPSPGLLKLSWSRGPQDVLIYDVLGRELKALPGELGYAEVNLQPGVYLVSRGEQRIRAVVRFDRSSVY